MQDNDSGMTDEANLFSRLMRKLTGRDVTELSANERKVIRRHPESKSIVEVTEELLRQTKK
jgi:hypothetical protein